MKYSILDWILEQKKKKNLWKNWWQLSKVSSLANYNVLMSVS